MIKLGEHLLYIDITSMCPFKCAFCMYEDRHTNPIHLQLNDKSRDSLSQLINSPLTRIVVSGEGEPLMNYSTFIEILDLSHGGKQFELITSGFPEKFLNDAITYATHSLKEKNDRLNVRISIDSYHIQEAKNGKLDQLIELLLLSTQSSNNVSFSFRSLFCDKTMVRVFISELLEKRGVLVSIKQKTVLDDQVLLVDGRTISINYKNLVYPHKVGKSDTVNMFDYMRCIEQVYKKSFTFGSLNTVLYDKGLDITVKPDGNVYFYGIEIQNHGNIFEKVSLDNLTRLVEVDPYVKTFYSRPLSDILAELISLNPAIDRLVGEVNNPYWIVKAIYNDFPKELDKIVGI